LIEEKGGEAGVDGRGIGRGVRTFLSGGESWIDMKMGLVKSENKVRGMYDRSKH